MRKSIWLVPLIASAMVGIAAAHPHGDGHRGAPAERLAAELGLDDAQKAEVQRIFESHRARRQAEREAFEASGQRMTREEMKAKRAEHMAELRQELSAVLTPEQLTKFDELKEKRHSRRRAKAADAEEKS